MYMGAFVFSDIGRMLSVQSELADRITQLTIWSPLPELGATIIMAEHNSE